MPRRPEQLDSRTRVVTPENIAFEYRSAGPFSRVGALLIDLTLQVVVIALTVFVGFLALMLLFLPSGGGVSLLELLGNLGAFTVLVLWFLMQWFYGAYFELKWNGQTPGKRSLGLRVLQVDGRPINLRQAILRNVLRVIDAFPFVPMGEALDGFLSSVMPLARGSQLVALVSMSLTEKHQRLGDLVCGTMVVAEDRSLVGRVEVINDPAVAKLQDAIPAGFTPGRTLSRALSHYVGRRRYFGPARRREIARHVGSVLIDRLGMPRNTDCDLLLCALYNRAYRGDTGGETTEPAGAAGPAQQPPPSQAAPADPEPTDWESVPLG